MTDQKATASRQLIGVQYLRAIAALMVAYLHTLIQIPEYRPFLEEHLLGRAHLGAGVDLFFVISGFIMVVTSSRVSPGGFALRRVVRIVPLYWMLTALLVVVASWRPSLFHTTVVTAEFTLKSLFFIPYANPGQSGELAPLLVPGWTLNLEMFFYAIFALVLVVPRNRRLLVTAAVFAAIVFWAPYFKGTKYGPVMAFYGNFKLFEFLFGMIIGQYYGKIAGLGSTAAGAAIALIGFWVLCWGVPFVAIPPASWVEDLVVRALPAAMVVFGTLSIETTLRKYPLAGLALLGDASYSMYLSHIFMLGVARVVWAQLGLARFTTPYAIGFALLCLTVTALGAVCIYRKVEFPLLRLTQHLLGSKARPAPGAPVRLST